MTQTGPLGPSAAKASIGLAILLGVAYLAWAPVASLASLWSTNEAYGHGFLMILGALYLGARRLSAAASTHPSWWGIPVFGGSLLMLVGASIAELDVVAHYALVGAVCGAVLTLTGWHTSKQLALPVALVVLAIPLPGFLEISLTSDLKLLSSKLGAWLLDVLGIPVYLEGNIIDLGVYRLHVADACAGLNYLFPLLGIGLLMAGFLHTTAWRKAVLVAATLPITLMMNVVRIAVAGLLVRAYGPDAASGFIHDFEGWMVFALSLVLLLPVAGILVRIGPQPTTLRDSFIIDFSAPAFSGTSSNPSLGHLAAMAAVVTAAVLVQVPLAAQEQHVPPRTPFAMFPSLVQDWLGNRRSVDQGTIDILASSDLFLADYRSPDHAASVELFAAYYGRQVDGATPHSPQVCLPGAGWEIIRLERVSIELYEHLRVPVNRALIQKDGDQMLVYYWFQQRGRLLANEFVMKWYIFQDSITDNRADGALVRVRTDVGSSVGLAEERLASFMRDVWPVLPRFIPD